MNPDLKIHKALSVYFVTFYTPPLCGGSEKQNVLVAQWMNSKEKGTATILGARLKNQKKEEYLTNTLVRRLKVCPWLRGLRQSVAIPVYLINLFFTLIKEKDRYNCLHVGAFDISIIAVVLAGKILKKRIVVRYASVSDIEKLKTYLLGRLLWKLIYFAQQYIVNSDEIKSVLVGSLGISKDLINYIPNAVYLTPLVNKKEEIRKGLNIPQDAFVCINVASFYPGKNQEILINNWMELQKRLPSAVLLLVGNGPQLESCRLECKKYPNASIVFGGRRNDILDCLNASDVFIFPSASEGMSNSLMEAMANGLPCIVSDIPQNLFLITNLENGIVCDFSKADEFISAIEELSNNECLAQRLGNAAKSHISEKFSIEKTGLMHLDIFQKKHFVSHKKGY